jgi:hypothetical protein
LGVYPDVSLKDARAKHAEARITLAKGINPSVDRKLEKAAKLEDGKNRVYGKNGFTRLAHALARDCPGFFCLPRLSAEMLLSA